MVSTRGQVRVEVFLSSTVKRSEFDFGTFRWILHDNVNSDDGGSRGGFDHVYERGGKKAVAFVVFIQSFADGVHVVALHPSHPHRLTPPAVSLH